MRVREVMMRVVLSLERLRLMIFSKSRSRGLPKEVRERGDSPDR